MFLYFSKTQAKNNDFRGPDVFVVMNTSRRERKSWVVWEEDLARSRFRTSGGYSSCLPIFPEQSGNSRGLGNVMRNDPKNDRALGGPLRD